MKKNVFTHRTRMWLILALVPILLSLIPIFFVTSNNESQPERLKEINEILITGEEIRNPEIALKNGILGYIEITSPGTPKSLSLVKGGEINVTIQLHFISHSPDASEAEINLDPRGGSYTIERGLGPGKGSVKLNDLIHYHPSGKIKLGAGQILPIIVTIKIPPDCPSVSIPLRAVGITADVRIIDEMVVDLNV